MLTLKEFYESKYYFKYDKESVVIAYYNPDSEGYGQIVSVNLSPYTVWDAFRNCRFMDVIPTIFESYTFIEDINSQAEFIKAYDDANTCVSYNSDNEATHQLYNWARDIKYEENKYRDADLELSVWDVQCILEHLDDLISRYDDDINNGFEAISDSRDDADRLYDLLHEAIKEEI